MGRRSHNSKPINAGEVWRSLPATLRRQVADDLAVVLREMIYGLGTREAASSPAAGGDLRSTVHPAPSADKPGEPSPAICVAAAGRAPARPRPAGLWTYVRDERPFAGSRSPAALFFYSPDRKGEHPRAHLKDFRGVIHADGYAGFNELFAGGKIVEAACWAHVRRKFFDVHAATASPIAKEALDRISQLYRVEETINGLPPDHRRRERQRQSKPIGEALAVWTDETVRKLSRKSELAAAFRYMRGRWAALGRCFDDGRLALDNNPAERALRGVAIGRKNYLFAGSDAGGRRAAAMLLPDRKRQA